MSADLSITIFIMSSTAFLALLPFYKSFSDHPILDMVLRRGSWVVASFLMVQNTAIVATIASNAGLDVSSDLFRTYMFIFGWGGYGLAAFLVITTLFSAVQMMQQRRDDRRMGHD